jgi:hypothetical protein
MFNDDLGSSDSLRAGRVGWVMVGWMIACMSFVSARSSSEMYSPLSAYAAEVAGVWQQKNCKMVARLEMYPKRALIVSHPDEYYYICCFSKVLCIFIDTCVANFCTWIG